MTETALPTASENTAPTIVYRKKVGGKPHREDGRRIKHGANGWIERPGISGRTLVYFNAHLPPETPWLERWVSCEEMRNTPKLIASYPGIYIGPWLARKIRLGRVVLVDPTSERSEPPAKTESVGRRPDPKLAGPIGGAVYA